MRSYVKRVSNLPKRCEQLVKDTQREVTQLEHTPDPAIRRSLQAPIRWLDRAIAGIEAAHRERSLTFALEKVRTLLTSMPGVGDPTAWHVMAFLPELGQGAHKSLAALVGVAPFNHDSGQ